MDNYVSPGAMLGQYVWLKGQWECRVSVVYIDDRWERREGPILNLVGLVTEVHEHEDRIELLLHTFGGQDLALVLWRHQHIELEWLGSDAHKALEVVYSAEPGL